MVRWGNLGAKALLLALLAVAVGFPDVAGFQGKGMGARAAAYPVALLVVPAIWWLRGRRAPYPHVVDMLVALPFLIDTGGNAADLYDTITSFDDVAHFLNWAILVSGFGLVVAALPIGRLNAGALAVGFGAVTHILWELLEWVVMKLSPADLHLTYDDTIGDLALSLAGSVAGGILTGTLLWRYRAAARSLVRAR